MGKLITDETLQLMLHITTLQTLNLHYCEKITDTGIQYVATLPHLRDLDIGDCYKVGRNLFSLLLPLAPIMTRLVILSPVRSNSFLRDKYFEVIPNFTSLKTLDIGGCSHISDKAMEYVAKLTRLTYLGISGTSVGDVGIHNLRKLVNLKGLSMQKCSKITSLGLTIMTAFCSKLSYLDLRGLPFGRDTDVLQQLSVLPFLEEMDFSNCYLTDEVLQPAYMVRVPLLKKMSIGYNSMITDKSVQSLTSTNQVQYLDISSCYKMTEKSLQYIAGCTSLRVVDLSHLYGISDAAVQELRAKRPDLKIIIKYDWR